MPIYGNVQWHNMYSTQYYHTWAPILPYVGTNITIRGPNITIRGNVKYLKGKLCNLSLSPRQST